MNLRAPTSSGVVRGTSSSMDVRSVPPLYASHCMPSSPTPYVARCMKETVQGGGACISRCIIGVDGSIFLPPPPNNVGRT